MNRSPQRGAALMVALMFLVILTLLGLAAVRATTQQTRMAAALQFQFSAFQAAEAAIRLVMWEISDLSPLPTILTNAASGTAQTRTPTFASGAVASSTATVTAPRDPVTNISCPGTPITGESYDKAGACCFDIEAAAQYGSTTANSVQVQRVVIACPSLS